MILLSFNLALYLLSISLAFFWSREKGVVKLLVAWTKKRNTWWYIQNECKLSYCQSFAVSVWFRVMKNWKRTVQPLLIRLKYHCRLMKYENKIGTYYDSTIEVLLLETLVSLNHSCSMTAMWWISIWRYSFNWCWNSRCVVLINCSDLSTMFNME